MIEQKERKKGGGKERQSWKEEPNKSRDGRGRAVKVEDGLLNRSGVDHA